MHARHTHYDVIIIGGGPAGSAAATALAQAGKHVLLTERATQPGLRIGESLLPNGNAFFEQLGVWDKIEAAGFVKKYGAEFETADGERRVENIFARGYRKRYDYSYQVQRPRFDDLLLDHAVNKGCTVDRQADITDVQMSGERSLVTAADGRTWTSRWVIDASGRRRLLGKLWKIAEAPNPYPPRIAVYNHFRDVSRRAGQAGGNIIITRLPAGWFWHIPLSEDTTSVGLVTLSADLRASGTTPAAWFQHNVAQSATVRRRMTGAEPLAAYQTTTDYAYMFEAFAGPRHLLVGDAATFSDPIFSSGVYLGLESALQAATMICRADAEDRPLSAAEQRAYTRRLKASTRVMRELIDTFYDDSGFAVFMNPTERLGLFPAINTIVAGNTRPDLSVRWRYALFRFICRMNRNYRMVPSVLPRR